VRDNIMFLPSYRTLTSRKLDSAIADGQTSMSSLQCVPVVSICTFLTQFVRRTSAKVAGCLNRLLRCIRARSLLYDQRRMRGLAGPLAISLPEFATVNLTFDEVHLKKVNPLVFRNARVIGVASGGDASTALLLNTVNNGAVPSETAATTASLATTALVFMARSVYHDCAVPFLAVPMPTKYSTVTLIGFIQMVIYMCRAYGIDLASSSWDSASRNVRAVRSLRRVFGWVVFLPDVWHLVKRVATALRMAHDRDLFNAPSAAAAAVTPALPPSPPPLPPPPPAFSPVAIDAPVLVHAAVAAVGNCGDDSDDDDVEAGPAEPEYNYVYSPAQKEEEEEAAAEEEEAARLEDEEVHDAASSQRAALPFSSPSRLATAANEESGSDLDIGTDDEEGDCVSAASLAAAAAVPSTMPAPAYWVNRSPAPAHVSDEKIKLGACGGRNTFLASKEGPILFQLFVDLFENDKDPTLQIYHQLTYKMLFPTKSQSMNVQDARVLVSDAGLIAGVEKHKDGLATALHNRRWLRMITIASQARLTRQSWFLDGQRDVRTCVC